MEVYRLIPSNAVDPGAVAEVPVINSMGGNYKGEGGLRREGHAQEKEDALHDGDFPFLIS